MAFIKVSVCVEIDGSEAVSCCLSCACLHASAIGLPTSCSPAHQLPKSVGPHPSTITHFASVWFLFCFCFFDLKNGLLLFLYSRAYIVSCQRLTCYSVNLAFMPQNMKTVQSDAGDISVDSAATLHNCRWVHPFIASWRYECILLSS